MGSLSDAFFPNNFNLYCNNLTVEGTQTTTNQTVTNLNVSGLLSACAASPGGIQTNNIISCGGGGQPLTITTNQLNLDISNKINLIVPLSIQGAGPLGISVPILSSSNIEAVGSLFLGGPIATNSFIVSVGTTSTWNNTSQVTLSAQAMIEGITTFTGTVVNQQSYATALSIIGQLIATVNNIDYNPAIGTMFTFIVSNQTSPGVDVMIGASSGDGGKVANAQPGLITIPAGKNATFTGYIVDPTLTAVPSILIYPVVSA
jgi:hypothetical protein